MGAYQLMNAQIPFSVSEIIHLQTSTCFLLKSAQLDWTFSPSAQWKSRTVWPVLQDHGPHVVSLRC